MAGAFSNKVRAFRNAVQLGEDANKLKWHFLQQLAALPLQADKTLIAYHEALLFTCAFPASKTIHTLAEKELKRITAFLKTKKTKPALINSGLPFTTYYSCFSHDGTRWLLSQQGPGGCSVRLHSFKDASLELNDVLKLTLPAAERSETTAALPNNKLMDVLQVPVNNRLRFIITELSKLDDQPLIKDHLYESLGTYLHITPRSSRFSISYNRFLPGKAIYYGGPVRSFDHNELLNRPVTKPAALTAAEQKQLVTVIKNAMALTDRETDTVTFMDENSLRYYNLEKGLAVAIYGMTASRQLPYESYVGFTLFANGFPAAYGGAWLFGPLANFGINIFEACRGGGSGFILCQLLRLYRQVFGIRFFEIEPYQFGLDNPDGIKTGAFWFYYKYGFRPLDKKLLKLSFNEKEKLKKNRQYRTPEKTLVRFTGSNMALQLGKHIPVRVADITNRIITLISKTYKSNRIAAEEACAKRFTALTGTVTTSKAEEQVLREVALWASAMRIEDDNRLALLSKMVKTKPADLYAYQDLLLEFYSTQH